MSPENKTKLQDAFRKTVERNPDADKPIPGWYMNEEGHEQATLRKLVEQSLAEDDVYTLVDKALAENPGLTIEKIADMSFGPKPKGPSPKP